MTELPLSSEEARDEAHDDNDTDTDTDPINLLRGWPNPALLPLAHLHAATTSVLSTPALAYEGLGYGEDPGYAPCREAVAGWLGEFYRSESSSPSGSSSGTISPDRLCITGGASQSLGALLGVYSDPVYTRAIWLVVPAYMLVFRIFEDAGFGEKLHGVPEDAQGIDLDFLRREMLAVEDAVRREQGDDHAGFASRTRAPDADPPAFKPPRARAKCYKHIIYCVPMFSNPSAQTMSRARREELVRLAREFDALIVADDVYDFLQWPAPSPRLGSETHEDPDDPVVVPDEDRPHHAPPPTMPSTAHLPRLVDVDRDLDGGPARPGADGFGNAMSNGSFSKIAGPGLRVGWVEGTEKFAFGISQAGITRSGGAPSQLTSVYLTTLLQPPVRTLTTFIHDVLQPAYARRFTLLTHAIQRFLLPLGFTYIHPTPTSDAAVVGGYFIWLRLPPALVAAGDFVATCERANLLVAGGADFGVPGDDDRAFDHFIRLCFAWEAERRLAQGIRRIERVARSVLQLP